MIEDIHWADRSTLAYLTYFTDRIERRRMLVVATYRSDEVGHHRLAEFASLVAKSSVSQLKLAPWTSARSTRSSASRSPTPRR